MKKFSNVGQLNLQDGLHAFILALIGGVVNILLTRATAGNFDLSWDVIWHGALVTSLSYISVKLSQGQPKSIEIDPTQTKVIELNK